MNTQTVLSNILAGAALSLLAGAAFAADYPAPKEGDWIVPEFKFHTGETLQNMKLHYTTVGAPTGEPVVILHGSSGSAANFLNADFAGELFGPGQPLDAAKYYIIMPDAVGAGKSAKPSDGLRAKFPQYSYDDMVAAQYRLVTEGLGVKHVRAVLGNSAGGMQTWVWAVTYPQFMDVAVPMAAQPSQMAGRNWMMRKMLTESIRRDPEWQDGNYTKQPTAFKYANVFFSLATSGGTQGYYQLAGTREKADKLIEARLAAPNTSDANDLLYQYESSRDYNPSLGLERIEATLLAINSADDERNPNELGIMDREIKRVKNGRFYLVPAGPDTRGHGTTGMVKFWKQQLQDLLQAAPRRAM